MKKFLTSLIIVFSIGMLLIGCNYTTPDTTEAADPMWGKGYYVRFNAYTTHSGHPSKESWYCLAGDNHLVIAPWTPPQEVKLEAYNFDPDAFTDLCTDHGYWQDFFNPEFVCQNTQQAWYGQTDDSDHFFDLLRLKDGMLLLASSAKNEQGSRYIYSVQVIEEKGTQSAYFSYWKDRWEPRQYEEDPGPYQQWKALYDRYK